MASIHPGSSVLEANKKVGRFPGGKDARGETTWINRTIEEDLFGVFDLAVFPLDARVDLVQVTTVGDGGKLSNVKTRQAKVGTWVRDTHGRHCPPWVGGIYVVGWVPRKHLRIWRWEWKQADAHRFGCWIEDPPDPAKLPRPERTSSAKSAPGTGRHPLPF